MNILKPKTVGELNARSKLLKVLVAVVIAAIVASCTLYKNRQDDPSSKQVETHQETKPVTRTQVKLSEPKTVGLTNKQKRQIRDMISFYVRCQHDKSLKDTGCPSY